MKKRISFFIIILLYAMPSHILPMAVDADVEYPQEIAYENDSNTFDVVPQIEPADENTTDKLTDQLQSDGNGFCSMIVPDEDY